MWFNLKLILNSKLIIATSRYYFYIYIYIKFPCQSQLTSINHTEKEIELKCITTKKNQPNANERHNGRNEGQKGIGYT